MHWLIVGSVLNSDSAGIRLTDVSRGVGATTAYVMQQPVADDED